MGERPPATERGWMLKPLGLIGDGRFPKLDDKLTLKDKSFESDSTETRVTNGLERGRSADLWRTTNS
jgi:hypothetical protein